MRRRALLIVLFVLARDVDAESDDASTIERQKASSSDSWRIGHASDSLSRYNGHARRLLRDAAPMRAWDAAGRFLDALDGSLADASANGCVLHEFNSLPNVETVDVSVRLDYHAMAKNGNLKRLGVMCDARSERGSGEAWCLGLERSTAFERHRKWWRRLSEAYEDGRHPYWLSEYLEFDMHANEVNPTASVFIETIPMVNRRQAEYVPALREYLEAIEETASERLYENIQAVIDAAMGDGFDTHMWAAGIMFSRSTKTASGTIDSVRVLIHFMRHTPQNGAKDEEEDGYRSEKTRQMVRLLEILNWTGDFDEFDRIDNYFLDDGGLGSVLQLDVLNRAPTVSDPSIIGPRVGVEITIGVADPTKNIMPRLNSLVDDGLVAPMWWSNFTAALCEPGPPRTDASNARALLRRPCAIRRRTAADKRDLTKNDGSGFHPPLTVAVSHLKFIVQPGRALYVKPYVTTQAPFAWCLDDKAYAEPESLPVYKQCAR